MFTEEEIRDAILKGLKAEFPLLPQDVLEETSSESHPVVFGPPDSPLALSFNICPDKTVAVFSRDAPGRWCSSTGPTFRTALQDLVEVISTTSFWAGLPSLSKTFLNLGGEHA